MTSRSQSSTSSSSSMSTSTSYHGNNSYGEFRIPAETELIRTCNKIDEEMVIKQVLTRPDFSNIYTTPHGNDYKVPDGNEYKVPDGNGYKVPQLNPRSSSLSKKSITNSADVNVGVTMINRFIGEKMTDLKAAVDDPKEYFGSVRETVKSVGTETKEMDQLMCMLNNECDKTNQQIIRINQEYEDERNKQFMSKAIH